MKKIIRLVAGVVLKLIYRVEVTGLENFRKAGKRVLIIANHTSFLDPALLWVFLPGEITFAINTHISARWWLKPFLGLSTVFPMDPTHPLSLKNLLQHVLKDTYTVIFPEGRITTTGVLMKIYDGPGMVADKSKAAVLPVFIDGSQYTPFSRLRGVFRIRLFPKIRMTILPHAYIVPPKTLAGKARRQHSGQQLADIMTESMFAASRYRHGIFTALLKARAIHGSRHEIAEDLERRPLTYDALIARVILLGERLAALPESGRHIGVLLPNSTTTLIAVLALQLHGKVPAMLNYTMGSAGMLSACRIACIGTILSSRKFIEKADLTGEIEQLGQNAAVVYLEDIAADIAPASKIKAWLKAKTADYWHRPRGFDPDSPAVVLFTSGSEGAPKGVVLSHANILANLQQLKTRISFNANDIVLNFLPIFHSFGFTVGTFLPVLEGMRVFFYPTPLHYTVIPEMAYEINATIMFGTNTFLAAYAKKAHPYDFYSLRYVVAGAEKLQDATRQIWARKFGIRILEGYGATETTPITSVNTPIYNKEGSVGRFMPHMDYRLEPIEGIQEGGRLHVKGPNIMLGYLLDQNPGVLAPPSSLYGDGWYDTGDIVSVDDKGYITIQGRSKRFAKIGGEMVSLTAVEQLALQVWPDARHAAVALADPKKGEQIILVTTQQEAAVSTLTAGSPGVAAILLPRKIISVGEVPLMASGKVDYPGVAKLVAAKKSQP